jgi:large subunit ribosomal protein L27
MSKTKSGGKFSQKTKRPGRHLGVKLYDGQTILPGQIIVRQRGNEIQAGKNVKRGRDFTLYAVSSGKIKFSRLHDKHLVNIFPK